MLKQTCRTFNHSYTGPLQTRRKMNIEEANVIVEHKLCLKDKRCTVMPEHSKEFSSCFAVYYQSSEYVESKDDSLQLVGHGAVLVDRSSGNIYETGSTYSIEYYANAYEKGGDPFSEPNERVEITEWKEGAIAVKAIKSIRQLAMYGLKDAKEAVDSVLSGKPYTIKCENVESAAALSVELKLAGFCCKQLWGN